MTKSRLLVYVYFVFFSVSIAKSTDDIEKDMSLKSEKKLSLITSPSIKPRKFSKGEALYIQNCSDCHGWEGRGNGKASTFMDMPTPILLRNELLTKNNEQHFVDWVLTGKLMPLQLKGSSVFKTDKEVNELLVHIKSIPNINWNEIETGQGTYDALCVNCHGLYGHGDGNLASQLPDPLPDLSNSDFQARVSDKELLNIITKGKGVMPGTEDIINSKEIERVIAYLRILSPGYETYDRFCANCHGVNGIPIDFLVVTEDENDYAALESIDIPSFDAAYVKTHTDKQLLPKIKHMLITQRLTMPHFSEQMQSDEAREIFRYLSDLLKEYP